MITKIDFEYSVRVRIMYEPKYPTGDLTEIKRILSERFNLKSIATHLHPPNRVIFVGKMKKPLPCLLEGGTDTSL
jgi:hypothetical protein